MKLHRNARTTPMSRRQIVERVLKSHWTYQQAAEGGGVSRRTWPNGSSDFGPLAWSVSRTRRPGRTVCRPSPPPRRSAASGNTTR
jgi:hypothetical protein